MSDTTALVTGASSGIGLEFAKLLASKNYNLIIIARNEEKLNSLKKELESKHGIQVIVKAKDLSKPEVAREIYDDLHKQNIKISLLINNAGFGEHGHFLNTSWQKESDMIQVNITSLMRLTKVFLEDMVAQGAGRILNVASVAAFMPGPFMATYFATKAFVLSFSEAIANELKGTGVTVTALCPGPTESGFQATANVEETNLVKGKKLPSSKKVAEFGYKALMRGKTVAVHGFMNRLQVFGVRFIPRSIVRAIVRKVNSV